MSISNTKLCEYSENEMKLFKTFNVDYLLNNPDIAVSPALMFREAVISAAINNIQGPALKALGRAISKLGNPKFYRSTPEWEELIYFEDEQNELRELIDELWDNDTASDLTNRAARALEKFTGIV